MAEADELFPGGGGAGALIRSLDWSATALGPCASWPPALRALVRALLHARQPMLLWWGPELVQLYNDAFVPSFGQGKHPAAMGQKARDCWPEVWHIVGAQIEDVIANGNASWHEDVLVPIFRNGRIEDAWWIYNYSPVFDDDGARVGVLIVCTETTAGVAARHQLERARREADHAREELERIFTQALQPIAIMTGPEHRFTMTNPAYDALVGRSVIGRTVAEAFPEIDADSYRPQLDRVLRTGEPVVVRETYLPGDGAPDRYFDVSYVPYRGPDGVALGVMAYINDVTASVVARKEIERSARARDEFLAMLGHELRNPLAPISTATQLMRMRGDHHQPERQIIERQVAHLSRLVDDLLDVARVARGQISLQRVPVEISDILSRAVETASPLLERHAHVLAMDVPRLGLLVDGDPVRLAQVIGNLVSNAAKYTPARGRIEIDARPHGDDVLITVADNGPGIPAELMPRLFELFVQGPRPIDRAEGGLGLGLALVRNLVTLHGGTVAAVNRPGGGSAFTVRLPRLHPAAKELHDAASSSGRPPLAAGVARRVLIVDDNEDAAELLSELLRRLGHEVLVTGDAPQALEVLPIFRPDVGLLDLGLPGMDGYELARRIRRENGDARLRLIAVTGYGQENDRENSRAAGFDHHLTKPVALDELIRVIGEG